MTLSILIPTLPERKQFLTWMVQAIESSAPNDGTVELIIDDRDSRTTTGEKRNSLIERATGTYVWQVDDDDSIYPYAIDEILKATQSSPDVIGINGIMTTNGRNEQGWEIRLGHPYQAVMRNGKEYYLRFPNHITPMKREHALKAKFEHLSKEEDYRWACALRDLNVLKTQVVIEKPVYHYKLRTNK